MVELKLYRMIIGMVETNVYFVENTDTKQTIIVDPADDPERLKSNLKEKDLIPAAIYLTHGHFDHIGAVNELKEYYKIPVVADAAEKALLEDPVLNMSAYNGKKITVNADVFVNDKDTLDYAGLPCTVIHTPGHTAGSCCYYFKEQKLLLSGDTLFQFSCGRTDFATSNHADMEKSLKRLMNELPEDVTACPGHMNYTTIEAEKRYNPFA